MTYETLFLDYKQAMRDKDALKKGVLTIIIAAVKDVEREQKRLVNEDEFIAIINREIKQTNQALAGATTAGREDLIEKENQKLLLLKSYRPDQMSVHEAISLLIANGVHAGMSMGEAMKIAKTLLNGKMENARLATIVKSLISTPDK